MILQKLHLTVECGNIDFVKKNLTGCGTMIKRYLSIVFLRL